jgi:hypothetical protein
MSRSRKPQYKVYKRVKDAQNFAKKLGVGEADYGERLDIANTCNHALFLLQEKSVPMPRSVKVKRFDEPGENPKDLAYYEAQPGSNAPGSIFLNVQAKGWAEICRTLGERKVFSTRDERHIIMHELGELAMHQSVGSDRFDAVTEEYQEAEEDFKKLDKKVIEDKVSRYATESHSEFVAEVFAGLMLGREDLRQDQAIRKLFRQLGGDKIVEWTNLSK